MSHASVFSAVAYWLPDVVVARRRPRTAPVACEGRDSWPPGHCGNAHQLPAGYRVVKPSVLGGLHHEYRMVGRLRRTRSVSTLVFPEPCPANASRAPSPCNYLPLARCQSYAHGLFSSCGAASARSILPKVDFTKECLKFARNRKNRS
jgi:hypothetical protein